MAAIVFTRSARKWPSLSSASSASVTLSRAWASPRNASVRVLIHFTGRPMYFDASSTSGVSLKIGVFMPKLPPVSPVMIRILLSGTLRTLASSVRVGARWVRPLHGGVNRVAAVGRVVIADRAARLHGGGCDTIDHKAMANDMSRVGECGLNRIPVANQFDETDIVGTIVPHARCAVFRGLGRCSDCRQLLGFHPDHLA